MSVVVDKEILAPGDYHTREGVVHVTLDRLRHWHYMGRKMLAKGLQIPVPWEHQDAKPRRKVDRLAAQARHNAGFVRGYFLDADGKLWGRLEFADQATARHVKERVRFVSPEIDPRFTDGDGEEWQDVITHLAVTPRPVHFRQSPFGTRPRLSHGRRRVWLSMAYRVGGSTMYHDEDHGGRLAGRLRLKGRLSRNPSPPPRRPARTRQRLSKPRRPAGPPRVTPDRGWSAAQEILRNCHLID